MELKLKIILFFFFVTSSSGFTIDCNFHVTSYWSSLSSVYSCEVTSINLEDGLPDLIGGYGVHPNGYTHADVKSVYFKNRPELIFFPKGIKSVFLNFVRLDIVDCGIEALNGDELVEYPNLEVLSMFTGKLKTIPVNFFTPTPNIQFIDFDNNKLEVIDIALIANLQLQVADFRRNVCINLLASSPAGIPALIDGLRQNCSAPETTTTEEVTTTTTLTTTTTNAPLRCETQSFEDLVCELDADITDLKNKISYLESDSQLLNASSISVESDVKTLWDINSEIYLKNSELRVEYENLLLTTNGLSQQNGNMRIVLDENSVKIEELKEILRVMASQISEYLTNA